MFIYIPTLKIFKNVLFYFSQLLFFVSPLYYFFIFQGTLKSAMSKNNKVFIFLYLELEDIVEKYVSFDETHSVVRGKQIVYFLEHSSTTLRS